MCGGRGYNHPPTCTCGWFPGLITTQGYTPYHLLSERERHAIDAYQKESRPMVLWYCYTEGGAAFVKRMPVIKSRRSIVRLEGWGDWLALLPTRDAVEIKAKHLTTQFVENGIACEYRHFYRVANGCIYYGNPSAYYDVPKDILDRDGVLYTDFLHPGAYFAKEPPLDFKKYRDCGDFWMKGVKSSQKP